MCTSIKEIGLFLCIASVNRKLDLLSVSQVGRLEEAVDYGRTHFEKFSSLKNYEDLVKVIPKLKPT